MKKIINILITLAMMFSLVQVGQVAQAEEKAVEEGVVYMAGVDSLKFDRNARVVVDDADDSEAVILPGSYALPSITSADYVSGQWEIKAPFQREGGSGDVPLYLGYGSASRDKVPVGIKCSGGDGSETAPFTFELVYDNRVEEVSLLVVAPEVGSSGDVDPVARVNVPFGAKYTIDYTNWIDEDGNLTEIDTFVSGQKYFARIILKTTEDYRWKVGMSESETTVEGATLIKTQYFNGDTGSTAFIDVSVIPIKPVEELTNVDIKITIPKVGDKVTAEEDSTYPDGYNPTTQSPIPEISVDKASVMEAVVPESGIKRKAALWLNEEVTLFVGEFEANKKYIVYGQLVPDDGYKFAADDIINVTANGIKIDDDNIFVTENILTHNTVMTFYAEIVLEEEKPVEELVYSCIEGDGQTWQKGSEDNLTFVFNSDQVEAFDTKDYLEIDGKKLDSSNYNEKKGSWVVELKADYLQTLAVGKHTIEAKFKDYTKTAVTAKFEIVEKKEETPSKKVYTIPKTGVE